MEKQFQHLKEVRHNYLLKLLQNFEGFFDRALGTWKTDPV